MLTQEDAQLIFALKDKGHGSRYIARTLGLSRTTVRRYLKVGTWAPRALVHRTSVLDGLDGWLRTTFVAHHGNAAVVHQQLKKEHGIEVTLRAVQKAVAPFRRHLAICAKATVRFETPAARQLQADFGERRVVIAGLSQRVHFAVLTLGFSRRCYVQAFATEKQLNWLRAIEGAFYRFGGVPEQLLVDNARALVTRHSEDEVKFNPTFKQFCQF
jgi:transposase